MKRVARSGIIPQVETFFPFGAYTLIDPRGLAIITTTAAIIAIPITLPGISIVVVSTQGLVNETCDEKRFKKSYEAVPNPTRFQIVREGVHDGLFTAREGEENWGIAHRVLMPAFGPISIRGMFDEMHDIATQLALKWARHGPRAPITVTDDFTRLTLDTLALCSMGFRFNSFYSPTLHPFVDAMGTFLVECGKKSNRLPLPSIIYRARDLKFEEDINVLRITAKEVLESRKAGKSDRRDLLTALLRGVDPKTGKHMTDESIMDNLITFLIAGHETTSGLLSFTFYQLLKYPEKYRKAQHEVDDVIGQSTIKVDHLSKLPYISAVLRETLRLNATIPLFAVEPHEDTLLAGKYPISKDETILNLLAKSHLDPSVYGDDADQFIPGRMLDAKFEQRGKGFPNSWKPFGNGMRACIGRPFAWQEALLVAAMLLQNFNFVLVPPLECRLAGISEPESHAAAKFGLSNGSGATEKGMPLTILYGSNSGTCESPAQRVASDAASHGFYATKVDCLDNANGNLPTDQPVVIITASYEDQPPENAGHFVTWIEGIKGTESPFKDVSYSYVSSGEVFAEFETWEDEILWPSLEEKYHPETKRATTSVSKAKPRGFDVTVPNPRKTTLRQDVKEAVVVNIKLLTKGVSYESHGIKKHLEIKPPEGMTYKSGDYLAVLPINPKQSVYRALRCFKLARDVHLSITTDQPTPLPVNESTPAYGILSSYVELSQPTTKRSLLTLLEYVRDEQTRVEITRLAGEAYTDEISSKRASILDILVWNRGIESVRSIADIYKVPRSTLRDRISGRPLRRDAMHNSRNLTRLEEDTSLEYIVYLDLRLFPPRLSYIAEMANRLLAERNRTSPPYPDGHDSHHSTDFELSCKDNNIITIYMPPYSSHIL
ncbi:hypothetical protein MRS44_018509 [Fusarium solani]|uniref:uncharacterized protein n=1 Tax=Fusarium solani TaxID=169388 RepID=UPI0032C406BF|nr:hypothetical protein MRS44_018509 [Fusarium solani]